ncbi:MAG TPA: hypothetical protein ENN61_05125, partial [Bacteroidaceae bacterium]|nr:hypothetical protein [Bacteroidaceae bacterium]
MNEYYLVLKRILKKEKKVILGIAAIIISLLIICPFIADMITGDSFHTTRIAPVENQHCMIYDIAGDRMLYRCSGSTEIFLSDLNRSACKNIGDSVPFYPVLDEKGEKFALYESAASTLGIYYVTDPDRNKQISIRDLKGTGFKDLVWSPGGDKIALLVRDSLNSSYYLYAYDLNSGEAKRLFSSTEYFSAPSWSPDECCLSLIAHDT